jgi:hypothetical protein
VGPGYVGWSGSGPWVCRRVGRSTDIHISSAALLSTLSYMDMPRLFRADTERDTERDTWLIVTAV